MPESGPVVKALEWFVSHSHEDVCSCSCTMNTDPNGFADEVLPLAREQEMRECRLREALESLLLALDAAPIETEMFTKYLWRPETNARVLLKELKEVPHAG